MATYRTSGAACRGERARQVIWWKWLRRTRDEPMTEHKTDPILVDARSKLLDLQQRAGVDDSDEVDTRRQREAFAAHYHGRQGH